MLTVSEALLFAARLRLPEGLPESEKMARVDDVIEKLGLGAVRDVRIGDGEKRGISGGEMRRVSIGLELVPLTIHWSLFFTKMETGCTVESLSLVTRDTTL